MNITWCTDVDVAGQGYFVTQGFNKYTSHKARCIVYADSSIGYPKDLWLGYMLSEYPKEELIITKEEMEKRLEETKQIIENTDFFIFRRTYLSTYTQFCKKNLNPFNHIMAVFGSECRDNPGPYYWLTEKEDITVVINPNYDYSETSRVGFSCQHIPLTLNLDLLPKLRQDNPHEKLRVAHCATDRRYKLTNRFLEIIKGLPLEVEIIEHQSWRETLTRKSTCDVNFDNIMFGTYGLSSIESMGMGQPSLAYLSGWTRSMYPDCPVVNVTTDTLRDRLSALEDSIHLLNDLSSRSKKFVMEHHAPIVTACQWEALIDFVREEKASFMKFRKCTV
jgi:hypothetical protein